MKCVILESPYAGDVERNVAYAKRAILDSLVRGEAPIASHLLFTQPGILDDKDSTQRELGINAGHAWLSKADKIVVYEDYGISAGMTASILLASRMGVQAEYRKIGK